MKRGSAFGSGGPEPDRAEPRFRAESLRADFYQNFGLIFSIWLNFEQESHKNYIWPECRPLVCRNGLENGCSGEQYPLNFLLILSWKLLIRRLYWKLVVPFVIFCVSNLHGLIRLPVEKEVFSSKNEIKPWIFFILLTEKKELHNLCRLGWNNQVTI